MEMPTLEDFSLEEICAYLVEMFSKEKLSEKLSNAYYDMVKRYKDKPELAKQYLNDSLLFDDIAKGELDE
jgi:hypothetical protein